MQNTIFLHTIRENKDNPQILPLIRELAFDYGKKNFKEIKEQDELNNAILRAFEQMCGILKAENLLNAKSVSSLIDGLTDAASEPKEQFLYKLIYEKERLERQIFEQKTEIKNSIKNSLQVMENFIRQSDFADKDETLNRINDAMFCELQMMEILREITESALLSVVEKGEDIKDTSEEIAKNIVYDAINEGDFSKNRAIEIAQIVIETAAVIANEDHAFAKDLMSGAICGAKEGVDKAIEKFKDGIKFAPNSQSLISTAKELIKAEDDFVDMAKNLMQHIDEPAASAISEVLEHSLDSYGAKFKRVQNEISEQLALRLEELKSNENINKFIKTATMKFEELRRELNETGDKFKQNLDASGRLDALKKEIADFEKKAEEKLEKYDEIGEGLKNRAKKLGEQIYETAQNFIKNTKEKMNKKDE